MKGPGGFDRSGPSPKILGRDIEPGNCAQIIIHVSRSDVVNFSVHVRILEQLLAWQLLASPHNFGDTATLQLHAPSAPAFAGETEAEFRALDLDMRVVERR